MTLETTGDPMDIPSITDLTTRALMLVLWLSLPTVLTAAAVGLLVAIVQAATQIQDQSIGQALKLIAVFAVAAVTAAWAANATLNFADEALASFGLPTLHKSTP
jgi:type III secretion protein S